MTRRLPRRTPPSVAPSYDKLSPPQIVSKGTVKGMIFAAMGLYPKMHAGLALCTMYRLPEELKEKLIKTSDFNHVTHMAYTYFVSSKTRQVAKDEALAEPA